MHSLKITIISILAVLFLCLKLFIIKPNVQANFLLKKGWVAALVRVWVAPAKQNTEISAFARMALFLLRRRLYGRFIGKPCRNANG